ncbi:hypothetical protein Goklo_012059 [Gossypium klotzschianum]|uniref:Uncharacterized protein n=1 Tax=Gossypium klotzschianum TaxID=34286 RepID=A0A7J8VB03_9ROSI|nr:hypothetical protein [Gossypium klotzschianum]
MMKSSSYSTVNMDLILAHLNTRKRVDVFALSIYGLVIFSKVLGHINDFVSDLFYRLDKTMWRVRVGPSTWDMGSCWICHSTCIEAV